MKNKSQEYESQFNNLSEFEQKITINTSLSIDDIEHYEN
jgi:hypothetical protein